MCQFERESLGFVDIDVVESMLPETQGPGGGTAVGRLERDEALSGRRRWLRWLCWGNGSPS